MDVVSIRCISLGARSLSRELLEARLRSSSSLLRSTPLGTISVPGIREGYMDNLTPQAVVDELDKFIVGQSDAKRAIAVALRNRYRRQQLPPELAKEIAPKNILLI